MISRCHMRHQALLSTPYCSALQKKEQSVRMSYQMKDYTRTEKMSLLGIIGASFINLYALVRAENVLTY